MEKKYNFTTIRPSNALLPSKIVEEVVTSKIKTKAGEGGDHALEKQDEEVSSNVSDSEVLFLGEYSDTSTIPEAMDEEEGNFLSDNTNLSITQHVDGSAAGFMPLPSFLFKVEPTDTGHQDMIFDKQSAAVTGMAMHMCTPLEYFIQNIPIKKEHIDEGESIQKFPICKTAQIQTKQYPLSNISLRVENENERELDLPMETDRPLDPASENMCQNSIQKSVIIKQELPKIKNFGSESNETVSEMDVQAGRSVALSRNRSECLHSKLRIKLKQEPNGKNKTFGLVSRKEAFSVVDACYKTRSPHHFTSNISDYDCIQTKSYLNVGSESNKTFSEMAIQTGRPVVLFGNRSECFPPNLGIKLKQEPIGRNKILELESEEEASSMWNAGVKTRSSPHFTSNISDHDCIQTKKISHIDITPINCQETETINADKLFSSTLQRFCMQRQEYNSTEIKECIKYLGTFEGLKTKQNRVAWWYIEIK